MTIGVPESKTSDATSGIREFIGNLSLEGLVRTAEDGSTVPWLAEGWSWERNFRQLRITLRPDILLHDGTRLDAPLATELLRPAVENTANRALYPTLNDIASLDADGDLDIVITLSRPSPLLLGDLSMQLRTGKDGMVGTGPFRVTSQPDSELILSRFDRYYGGKPTIEEVVVKPFDALRTAWSSLLRGEVDVVSDVPADAVEFIRNDDVQVIRFARRYQLLFAFNSQKGPLRLPSVRRALNLAVDRQGIVERVLRETATVSAGPLWPRFWAYDGSVQPLAFDPRQAAALLEEAGYLVRRSSDPGAPPSRFRFTCLIPENFSVWEHIALEVQKDLLNVGVDMQIRVVSPGELNERIRAGQFEAVLIDMFSGPTPSRAYVFWRSRRAYEGGLNVFGYENAEAERLFTTLNTSMNDAAVRSATRRLQEVLLSDPPALYVAWTTRARAIRRAFAIPDEGGDPLLTLWKWTPSSASQLAANR